MPDIIKQLEEGKKLQEEGFDEDALRTKITSEEEQEQKPEKKKKPKKQKPEQKEDKEQAAPEESKEESKPEKYPGFDFNNFYEKGQVIHYIKLIEKLGIKELLELKIRTIYPKMIVAVEDKKCTHCIGPDSADMIFVDYRTASETFKSIKINAFKDVDIKEELGDIETQDTEE